MFFKKRKPKRRPDQFFVGDHVLYRDDVLHIYEVTEVYERENAPDRYHIENQFCLDVVVHGYDLTLV